MQVEETLARLLRVHREHGGLTVAVDFDNTLFDFHFEKERQLRAEYDFSEIHLLLQRLRECGCFIIIWTANEDEEFIKKFLAEKAIPYDAINANPPFFKSPSRKIYYNVLLDDAAGLRETYLTLLKFIQTISTEVFPTNKGV
jgi:hypothetical protein